ncbi:LytTR family transcriptional regulator [Blautia schinkii]|nr:LytTR family transcriptional regulator [Blautia schinkii]
MRVELHIESGCEEPYAVLHVAKLSASLQAAIEILEKESQETVLTAQSEGKLYVIDPERVEVIRTEGRELALYDRQKKRFVVGKPLYELSELLGSDFVRISKSAIINFRRIHHVQASFNGTMEVVMKNGVEEVITRSYRQQFKKRLGV